MQSLHRKALSLICLVLLALVFGGAAAAQDQPGDNRPPGAASTNLPQQNLVGWLHVIIGDPPPGSNLNERQITQLTDGQGNVLAQLELSENTAQIFNGQQVQVIGRDTQQAAPDGSPLVMVETIQALNGALDVSAQAVTGSQPWLIALCRFPDVAGSPHPPAWYEPLFGTTYPGLDHYWQQTSYGNINLSGTTVISQWFTLPQPRSAYVGSSTNLNKLAQDCSAVMDASVYFPQYIGINFVFNADLGCCAWGGSTTLNRDGQSKLYRVTWMPPWSQTQDIFGHEMGHAFGFPHSSGPSIVEDDGFDTYGSMWDVMSWGGGTCVVDDAEFGCLSTGTIAYHLDIDGWIAANRRVTVLPGQDQTITLERLQLPVSTTNPLIAKASIGGSGSRFYSVEARFLSGYDQNIPGTAVIIHDVNVTHSDEESWLVDALDGNDDMNDAGAMWLPGETFTDAANGISIQVLSAGASSYSVRIINNSTPQLFPDAPSNLILKSNTLDSLTLEWQDNSFNETGFNIYKWGYDPINDVWDFLLYDDVAANQTTFTDNVGVCGQEGYYSVSAFNANAESDLTDWIAASSILCSPINAAPQLNHFTDTTPTLTWTAVSWAVEYEIQIAETSNFSGGIVFTAVVPASQLSVTVSNPLNERLYYWRVRPRQSNGTWGAWSAASSFTINTGL